MLVLVPVECARPVELLSDRADCSGVVARLSRSPLTLWTVLWVVLVVSSWRHVVVPASVISVAWKTRRDHAGSSLIVKVSSQLLSSLVKTSVPAVKVVVATAMSQWDVCFVTYGVFSVSPIVGVL